MMEIGDTFVAPGGRQARFRKGRPMQVINVMTVFGEVWVDAEPVERRAGDEYWHQTYRLEELTNQVPLASVEGGR